MLSKKEWIEKHAKDCQTMKIDPGDMYEELLWKEKYTDKCKGLGLDPEKELERLCKQESKTRGDKYGSHGPLPAPNTTYPSKPVVSGDELREATDKEKLKNGSKLKKCLKFSSQKMENLNILKNNSKTK